MASEVLPLNIPEPLRPAVSSSTFEAAFEIGTWLNPFYLRGDFNGDGAVDYAILVKRRRDGKKGIVVWLASGVGYRMVVIGAGTKSRAGASDSDNWDFFDSWQVYGKRGALRGAAQGMLPKLIGEAILIEMTDSSSGLLYWDGKQFRWYQQGD